MRLNRISLRLLLLLSAPLLTAVGCSAPTRSFDVGVRNDGIDPVVVWLTKNVPADEPQWMSPEQYVTTLAGNDGTGDRLIPGVLLKPGETASLDDVRGKFPHDVYAVLRIYRGELSLNELLATSRDQLIRDDIILYPGDNQILIRSTRPLQVERIGTP